MTLFALLLPLLGCDARKALVNCEGGNTQACFSEGQAAMAAAKPKYDVARARFNAACRPSRVSEGVGENIPAACASLAALVRDAKGGPRDLTRAAELFQIACKEGIDRACVDLGALLYSDEPEREEDAVRAVVFFDQGCSKVDLTHLPAEGAHELADACERLGHAYEAGVGVIPPQKDPAKAEKYYDLACRAKHAAGCVSQGNLAASTKAKADLERAAALYDTACKLDARQGCFELAELHANKKLAGATDDTAVENYKRTCGIDPTHGCYEAGRMMEDGRVKAGEGEIASLYNQACEHGNADACARRAISQK